MTDTERKILDCGQELFAALYELDTGKYYSVIFEWRGTMNCFYFKIYRGKYKLEIGTKKNLELEVFIQYKDDNSSHSKKTLDFYVCTFYGEKLSYPEILEKIKYMTEHKPSRKKIIKNSSGNV